MSITDVAELFKTYFEKLEYTNFSGSYPYETELILKNIKTVSNSKTDNYYQAVVKNKLYSESPGTPDVTDIHEFISDVFKYYGSMKSDYLKMRDVYEIFNKYVQPISESMSSSYSSSNNYTKGLADMYDRVVSTWESFKSYADSMITENLLTNKILAAMKIQHKDHEGDIIKTLTYIKKLYDEYKGKIGGLSIIDLYSGILRSILDENKHGPTVRYINSLVEELKDEILPPLVRQTNNRKSTVQLLIQRYRLIPDGPSRPLSELIQQLVGVKTSNDIESLNKVAKIISKKDRKYGFIVISKRLARPIENNIWLLTDVNYLQKHKLMTPLNVGICDTVIKRTQTIKFLEPLVENTSKDAVKDGIYYMDSELSDIDIDNHTDFYYVLETLDGVTFRVLFPWYISIFAREKIYEIPAYMTPDFTNIKSIPSTRVEAYNEILEDAITMHLQKPLIETADLSKMEKQQVETKWAVIRKKIAVNMLEDYRNVMQNVTKDNILSLIRSPEVFANSLKYIINISSKRSEFNVEIYMTALKSLNDMKRGMIKDVITIYKRDYEEKILKLLEGGSNVKTIIKILDILEDILVSMLEIHITEKNNIYALIQQKSQLLEKISV